MHHSNHRIGFKSKFGAIAALAGSAVGLGNIWKFPYVAGTNGGGAFLLVYIFFTIAIGLPVMLAEFSLGRRSKMHSVLSAYWHRARSGFCSVSSRLLQPL